MDRIMEQLSKLQELTDAELSELEESALSEFETTQQSELTSESVASMTRLADAVEAVRTEKARRVTEAEAFAEQAAEAAARINPEEASTPTDQPDDEEPAGTTPDDSEPEVPVDDDEEPADTPADTKKSEAFSDTESSKKDEDGEKDEEEDDEEKKGKPFSADESKDAATEAAADETTEAAAEQPTEAEASEAPAEESEAEASNTTPQNDVQEDTVTADAAPQGTGSLAIEAPAGRQPQIKPTTTLSITAGADVPGYSAGATLKDSMDVASAFQRRLHSLRHVNGGDGEQHIVASYRQEFPSDRFLSATDPMENSDKIQSVTSLEAITAAAGICTPLETRYELGCDVGVTNRPIRDALARFGSDRGGVRYFSAPVLEDMNAATGFWRRNNTGLDAGFDATDFNGNTVAEKPCLEAKCTAEMEAYIEAVTLCLTFSNMTTRTFPELIKRQNDLALVAHSRIAENALLGQIADGSTQITMPAQRIGAARELFNTLGLAIAAYRHKHRMDTVSPLRMIVPAWVRDFLKADLAMQMPGDGLDNTLGVADAKIDGWFRSRGVNITWHLDGVGPALGGGTPDDPATTGTDESTPGFFSWPTELEFGLFAEGTWLFLDGGTLDLGVIRDSSLVASNEYKQFVETFEGVANIGCDSYWMSAALTPTGQAAALVDTLV